MRDNSWVFNWLPLKRRAEAVHWNGNLSYSEMAELIERFLERDELYPQEWNDFVEVPQREESKDVYRRRCYELDPLVNSHEPPEADAIAELRSIIRTLRERGNETKVNTK